MKKYFQVAAVAAALVAAGGMESAFAYSTEWNALQFTDGDATTTGYVGLLSSLSSPTGLFDGLESYFASHSISDFVADVTTFTTSLGYGPSSAIDVATVLIQTVSDTEDYNLSFSGSKVLINGGDPAEGGYTITAVPGPTAGAGIPALVAVIGFAGYAAYRRQKLA